MKKDTNIYYIRYDSGRHSTVFAGTFEYLKRNTFQGMLQDIKDHCNRPFRWPRDIESLVHTLNFGTWVLNNHSDFYTLTSREMAEQKHWPIIDNNNE